MLRFVASRCVPDPKPVCAQGFLSLEFGTGFANPPAVMNLSALRSPALSLLAVLVAVSSCKPKPPVPVLKRADGTEIEAPPPPDASDEEKAAEILARADALRAEGNTAEADGKEEELLQTHPGTRAAATVFRKRGEAAYASHDPQGAVDAFEKLLFYRPQYREAGAIRENYARALIDTGRAADAAAQVRALLGDGGADSKQIELGLLLADALARSGAGLEALEIVVDLHEQRALTPAQKATVEAKAPRIVDAMGYDALQAAWSESQTPDWRFIAPAIGFRLTKMYYHVRDFEKSEAVLQEFLSRHSDSTYGEPAREFKKRFQDRFDVNPKVVGVLLPLSGRFKPFGERSLAAIKLALGESPPFELVVKDTQADANATSRAVEELVLEHHVMAIIGPLFSSSAHAAATKAEELTVPLITLSHRAGLPQMGPWIFRTGLTIEAQAESLAKVAFDEMGFTKFALMWPRSRYGVEFTTAFWREVEKRGGEITAAQSYEHDQTTFRDEVRRIVGRYYLWARWDYRRELDKLKARKLPSHRFKAALDDVQKNVPPIVDFDAIVIPDTGKNIGLLAPALAVEDIVMTRDPKMLQKIRKATGRDDIHPVTLMGGSTWNHPQTPESCDRYCEEAIFVDGYYPDSPDPKVRDFVAKFRDSVGADPVLSDAQAFDTAKMLVELYDQAPATRKQLREALLALVAYHGVTGKVSFEKSGEALRELFVLTIEEREIKRWNEREPEG